MEFPGSVQWDGITYLTVTDQEADVIYRSAWRRQKNSCVSKLRRLLRWDS